MTRNAYLEYYLRPSYVWARIKKGELRPLASQFWLFLQFVAGPEVMQTPVSVIIPCFNEERGIASVIQEIRSVLTAAGLRHEILVVDDGSTNQSAGEALAAGARVVRHRSNRGYGASLKTGIVAAAHSINVIIDADGTYPACNIPELVKLLDRADAGGRCAYRRQRQHTPGSAGPPSGC